ncbi:MAG: hypothetical protein ABI972_14450 [Acidobacteriota bacterium]
MERVLGSEAFGRAERQARFLRYVVDKTLAGQKEDLKEFTIALEVFDRDASYDPKQDSTVRVEASKLRARLERYYEGAGDEDGIRIEMPKGGYVARFVEVEGALVGESRGVSRRRVVAGGLALGAMGAGAVVYRRLAPAPELPVILVASETAERGGYGEGAAEVIRTLANELGFRKIRVIQARDLDSLAAESKGASYVVTAMAGRCWEDGGRLRLVAELREVNFDFRVWSGVWEDEAARSGDLGRKGAAGIAEQADKVRRMGLPGAARERALEPYAEALRALRPRKDFVLKTTDEKKSKARLDALMRAARLLEEAVRRDASFAEGLAQLAWVYRLAIPYDRGMVEQAGRTARRALEVDPDSAEGNYVKGYLALLEEWDIGAAEAALRKCVQRSAFYVEAYRLYADAATIRGRAREALGVLARPLSVMPREKVLRFAAATTMLQAGEAAAAERMAREELGWEPQWALGHWELGRALEAQGRLREAEAQFRGILKEDPKNQRYVAALAHLLAGAGEKRAMELLLGAGMDQTAPSLAGLNEAARAADAARG